MCNQVGMKISTWIRADDVYFVGEIYTLYDRSVWFFAEKGLLSVDNASTPVTFLFCI